QELELPEASTAVQVTVFEPTGNVQVTVLDMTWQREAVGDEQLTVGWLSQRSVASGNGNETIAEVELRGFSATFSLGGQMICGGVVSTMRTVRVAATELVALTTPTGWPRLLA